jgi:solute carrier family 41
VPALLGLKGNLDMTLAARLSTQANIGNMTSKKEIVHMVVGNIAIVQVQAVVAAFLVSLFALGVGVILNGTFSIQHALLLTASAMFTATSASFVLGRFGGASYLFPSIKKNYFRHCPHVIPSDSISRC